MTCNPALLTPINADTSAIVVGGGRSGQAAARLLRRLGATVRLLERNAEKLPAGSRHGPLPKEWKSSAENTGGNTFLMRTSSFPVPARPYPCSVRC